MKETTLPRILTLSFGLSLAALLPQVAKSQSVQFELASDLASFNQVTAADAVSVDFTHSATGGTGGSGGLVHAVTLPEDTTAIYTPLSYDLTSGATFTVSIDFLTGTVPLGGAANAVAMVGFTGNNNTGFYSNPADSFIGGRVRHQSGTLNGLQSQTKIVGGAAISAPANGSITDIVFTSDNWYRLTLSVTRDGLTANQFAYAMTLQGLGATGTSVPTPLTGGTLSGTYLNADLYNDTTTFAAFRGVPTVTGGDVAFDNFTVTVAPVPEPASVTLAALCGLGLLLFARKQRR